MVITAAWLDSISTVPGYGYTRAQVTLLGIPWPLPHAWKTRLIGTEIPDTTAQNLEALKGVVSEKTLRIRATRFARLADAPRDRTGWDAWVDRPNRYTGPGWSLAYCTACHRLPSACACRPAATYRAAHDRGR